MNLSKQILHVLILLYDCSLPCARLYEIHTKYDLSFVLLDFIDLLCDLFHYKTICCNFYFCTKQHFLYHLFRNMCKHAKGVCQNRMVVIFKLFNIFLKSQMKSQYNFYLHLICLFSFSSNHLHSCRHHLHLNQILPQIFRCSYQIFHLHLFFFFSIFRWHYNNFSILFYF